MLDETDSGLMERTGHSRHLRQVLRAARERRGFTQQQVAEKITEMLQLDRPLSSSSVSEWERFGRHPAVNVMAAWARVVGLRLVVDLDAATGERIPVLLHPDTADLARAIDLLDDESDEAAQKPGLGISPHVVDTDSGVG